MISFDEALALVLAEARPLPSETVPIADVWRRRLAAPVIAAIDAPRVDVSVMDGYAVRDADLDGEALDVVGQSFPGLPFEGQVPVRGCVRIFTGAPIPLACDRVIPQEQAVQQDSQVRFEAVSAESRFIRSRGMDFRAGDVLLEAGRIMDSRAQVAAAGGDCGDVTAYRIPRMTILATGNELVPAGEARTEAFAVPESASYGVVGLGQEAGTKASVAVAPDDLAAIATLAGELVDATDVIVVIGGASVGEKDFAKAAFDKLGMRLIFSRVAMRPGKPVWFGRLSDCLVLGLPGNPTSAMVTARLYLKPLLAGLSGGLPATELNWRTDRLAASLPSCDQRETFVRAQATSDGAMPLDNQDSGAQQTLADADLLIRRRPHSAAAEAGSDVEVIDF